MQTLLAWIWVPAALMAGYPWAAWLTTRNPRFETASPWLTVPLTPALSAGLLSLVILWEQFLGVGLRLTWITRIYALDLLPRWPLWRRVAPRVVKPLSSDPLISDDQRALVLGQR